MYRSLFIVASLLLLAISLPLARGEDQNRTLVLVAGKPSHPPRMHEFNAGVQLLAQCLRDTPGLTTKVVLNGWPEDEALFENADAVVFFMDGGRKHEVVKTKERLALVNGLVKRGVGIGCMHYGVEVIADEAGDEFKRWIGGHYENMHSCNPMWEPEFASFPDHPVTRGVKPFQVKDEWYFNMRFINDIVGNEPATANKTRFTPILTAAPSEAVRNGPYVYPKGPYKHIQAASGRAEAMMWVVERPDGGRGFGFTGGHYHDNWGNDNFRKVVLNALLWVAKTDPPEDGVQSQVSKAELNANLDPKKPR